MSKLKHITITAGFMLLLLASAQAQRPIRDVHVRHQRQRMTDHHWDHFTPNPAKWNWWKPWNYPIDWAYYTSIWLALDRNKYKSIDRRPLGPIGPYTQRLALQESMHESNVQIEKHSVKLRNEAAAEMYNYQSMFTGTDPLWLLYYKSEFAPLLNSNPSAGLSPAQQAYMQQTGVLEWYNEESRILKDRLEGSQKQDMDRGQRMLTYHRMLQQFHALQGKWVCHVGRANTMMKMQSQRKQISAGSSKVSWQKSRTDKEIAKGIFSKARLKFKQ